MENYDKYLKYKQKYLEFKNLIGGGGGSFQKNDIVLYKNKGIYREGIYKGVDSSDSTKALIKFSDNLKLIPVNITDIKLLIHANKSINTGKSRRNSRKKKSHSVTSSEMVPYSGKR